MGGIVARWFAEVGGGRDVVRQIVTLGTPFGGSLNAVQVLAHGDYLPFGLFADALRDTARTFPGVYELVSRYRCVSEGGQEGARKIDVGDMAGIGANGDLAEDSFDVHARLAAAVEEAGDTRCSISALVGVQQPTSQGVRFLEGTAVFQEHLKGVDHRGDGTVYRYSAAPRDTTSMPLPQQHGALAKTDEAIAFVEAVLTQRDLGEVQAAPGLGIRVPDAVRPGQAFDVHVVDGEAGATCRLTNAETNTQVAVATVKRRGDGLAATVSAPAPGVYRVTVASGGYTPVEELILAVGD
jgi:hypothetical protein